MAEFMNLPKMAPMPALPKAAAPALTGTVRKDLRSLDKAGAKPGTPVSPLARLSVSQLYEVERMAAQGMNLAQIGVRLRVSEDVWQQYIAYNPDLVEAFQAGAVRGVDVASKSMFGAVEKGDVGAARYYLDRLGGPQFAPKPQGPAVVVNNGTVNINPDSVSDAMDRQRKLLDGDFEEVDSGAA